MNRLVLTPNFRRAYGKSVKRDRALQVKIDAAIQQLERNVFQPQLGTHKLSGKLRAYGLAPVATTVASSLRWKRILRVATL
jgi:mRNA-degrading endonuclease YafQ of YafQ-DinJ toxin-antitoxin module